jgi:bacillithiol system protein YtxJ
MKNWLILESEEDLRNLIEKSVEKPQIIFKDSVTCGISAHAKERLTEGFDLIDGKADFHYLDLLRYRSTSNLIAEVLEVTHRSPQIIVVKNREAVYTTSHHSINPATIASHL